MGVDNELAKRLWIPTVGMESFDVVTSREIFLPTRLYDEITLTKFYTDSGQLHHNHNGATQSVYYVQREDGKLNVVSAGLEPSNAFPILRKYLDPKIKAEVIKCNVPAESVQKYEQGYLNSEYGALEFLAQHHPSGDARVQAIALLMEMAEHEKENTSRTH